MNKVCLSPNPPLVQVGEHRYQVETAYFSPDGALLRYNRGKVVFLVNTKVGCVGYVGALQIGHGVWCRIGECAVARTSCVLCVLCCGHN